MIAHIDTHDPVDRMHECEVCAGAVRVALNKMGVWLFGPKDAEELVWVLKMEARSHLQEVPE